MTGVVAWLIAYVATWTAVLVLLLVGARDRAASYRVTPVVASISLLPLVLVAAFRTHWMYDSASLGISLGVCLNVAILVGSLFRPARLLPIRDAKKREDSDDSAHGRVTVLLAFAILAGYMIIVRPAWAHV